MATMIVARRAGRTPSVIMLAKTSHRVAAAGTAHTTMMIEDLLRVVIQGIGTAIATTRIEIETVNRRETTAIEAAAVMTTGAEGTRIDQGIDATAIVTGTETVTDTETSLLEVAIATATVTSVLLRREEHLQVIEKTRTTSIK